MPVFAIGLPRMHKEPGERRDFLPDFVHRLAALDVEVVLEHGYGSGMGIKASEYLGAAHPEGAPEANGRVRFAPRQEVYGQPNVLVLRYPDDDDLALIPRGGCLITMAHYPTRPGRIEQLRALGLEVISLDGIKDDVGRRLVENLRAVGWNGVEAGFQALGRAIDVENPARGLLHVMLLGSGAVGGHAMQAAIRYGDVDLWQRLARSGVPGVVVTVVDYDVTRERTAMLDLLARTDVLVDATQRPDPSRIVIPNSWIGVMPEHAVLVDLSVDPYDCNAAHRSLKGIEGIPQGNLDQYIFEPDDPAFEALPDCVDTTHRRTSVSCYSWPGVHPRACMETYGPQIFPLVRAMVECGGVDCIDPHGSYFQRAVSRAMLSRWTGENGSAPVATQG